MQAQSLGWGDTLEEEMATHSSILPGESHGHRSLWAKVHRDAQNRRQLRQLSTQAHPDS